MKLDIWPDAKEIDTWTDLLPDYVVPNRQPFIAFSEGYLDQSVCEKIVQVMSTEEYSFPGCNAITREAPRPLDEVFRPLVEFTMEMNSIFWQYIVTPRPAAWMQTYVEGSEYKIHMDASLGQTRKLTAIALLSSPNDYKGGQLQFYVPGMDHFVPEKTQGSIFVYPHWLLHEVLTVTQGVRHSINLGFWGPPFR